MSSKIGLFLDKDMRTMIPVTVDGDNKVVCEGWNLRKGTNKWMEMETGEILDYRETSPESRRIESNQGQTSRGYDSSKKERKH